MTLVIFNDSEAPVGSPSFFFVSILKGREGVVVPTFPSSPPECVLVPIAGRLKQTRESLECLWRPLVSVGKLLETFLFFK